jgi:hypothetical protein
MPPPAVVASPSGARRRSSTRLPKIEMKVGTTGDKSGD